MIKLNKINKYYNKKKPNQIHVINNTSIELPDKGLVAFLGKSGCGKTTLLNVMSGLDSFGDGIITVDEMQMDKYNSKLWDSMRSKKIGYIFQNYNLFTDKTVYENLEISLKLAGEQSRSEIDKRIDYALNLVGLAKYKKRRPNTLSGGQQQRVGIARAMVKGSSIIIADEPTGNLDSDNTFEIMDILKSISKTCLVVLVTHEENIANFFADRIIKIKDGQIVEDYLNNSNDDLNITNNKAIYLKDLKYNYTSKTDNLTVNYRGDNNSEYVLNIIEKEGKIYIDTLNSPIPVVLVNRESEIKLINSHYEDKKKGEHKSIVIDNTLLSPIESDVEGKVISSTDTLRRAWKNYRSIPFKKKIISHLMLFCIAVVLCVIVCYAATVLVYDYSSYNNNTNIIEFRNMGLFGGSGGTQKLPIDEFLELEGNNYILQRGDIYFVPLLNHSLSNNEYDNNNYLFNNTYFSNLIGDTLIFPDVILPSSVTIINGSYPLTNENEIIIDLKTAKDCLSRLKLLGVYDYNFLIGEHIIFQDKQYTIIGIIDSGYKGAWVNETAYNDLIADIEYVDHLSIYTDNKEGLRLWSVDNEQGFRDLYQEHIDRFVENKASVFSVVTISVLISMFLMVFIISHTIRASFINRIKEIGTYRCIGVKKSELVKEFIFENIIKLCFSAVIGVILTAIVMRNVLAPFLISQNDFIHSRMINFIIALVFILAVNIGITISFVYGLLKLTPAEIIAKYDI